MMSLLDIKECKQFLGSNFEIRIHIIMSLR